MRSKKNRVTIAEVAKYANVSTMTVSRVVNKRGQVSDDMRKLVHSAMDVLGYRPNRIARSLVSSRTFKIGVIVPNIASLFFTTVLESIEYVLWQHDYSLVLSNSGQSNRREQDILDVFEEDQVDGVLIFGSHLTYDQLTTLLQNQRAAVVFNGEVDPSVAGQIIFDDQNALKMAVQYLIDVGRTKLTYVGLDKQTYSMRERRQSFEAAIATCDDVEGWVINADADKLYIKLRQHLKDHPQTNGLICFNDEMAADVLVLLSRMGKRVPDDVAVIGYDDVKLARWVTPRLSTIKLKPSIGELGELAAQMLLERIDGNANDKPVILNHELVVRDSTP